MALLCSRTSKRGRRRNTASTRTLIRTRSTKSSSRHGFPFQADIADAFTDPERWLDPLSVGCGFIWMALHILAEPMLEHQLRKAPLPVDMWSRWPQLRRPGLILLVSLLMAAAAVGLR